MAPLTLLSLPPEILALLPDHLQTIEDLLSTGSTCRALRHAMDAARPPTILRLAAAQTRIFFRPSPHYLVTAAARELGHWARQSEANEQRLALSMREGLDGLLELAAGDAGCGLTMARIRELHEMRFSLMNPVTDIIDKCVGQQWYATPNFWDGGVDDAYTIDSAPSETLFHLAIYGELFGPDLDALLDPDNPVHKGHRPLTPETRLEYVKYSVPDTATHSCGKYDPNKTRITAPPDTRRMVHATGPYRGNNYRGPNHNLALTWTINSSRWRPRLAAMRNQVAGVPEFWEDSDPGWWYEEEDHASSSSSGSGSLGNADHQSKWRQRMWENIMVCQGLEGLQMLLLPQSNDDGKVGETTARRGRWADKVRGWRRQIAKLEREPALVKVGRQATLISPYLLGDLRICVSGYVPGS
ncbi:hypothetical protein PG991_005621 [Apiospora marii]|uniref:F-box domain-containing protein n=1 Tax=Apiospora marii TaxID=335849 RepID=A0ABR1S9Q4_9PEZI